MHDCLPGTQGHRWVTTKMVGTPETRAGIPVYLWLETCLNECNVGRLSPTSEDDPSPISILLEALGGVEE
jgi:hypothetical protein